MKMLISLLSAALCGFAAHQTRPFLYKFLGQGWVDLASYTFGVLLDLPFKLSLTAIFWKKHQPQTMWEAVEQDASTYLLSFLGVGIGTGAGFFMDEINSGVPTVSLSKKKTDSR